MVRARQRGAPLVIGGSDYKHKRPHVKSKYLAHLRREHRDSESESENSDVETVSPSIERSPKTPKARLSPISAESPLESPSSKASIAQAYDNERCKRLSKERAIAEEAKRREAERAARHAAEANVKDQIMVREKALALFGGYDFDIMWLTIGFREFRKLVRLRVHPKASSKMLKLWYHALDSRREGTIDFASFLCFAVRPQATLELQHACHCMLAAG